MTTNKETLISSFVSSYESKNTVLLQLPSNARRVRSATNDLPSALMLTIRRTFQESKLFNNQLPLQQ